jgi:hypothetical protein
MAEHKQIQFSIDDGPTFFADEISVTNNEQKFYFDFKNASPRIDARSQNAMPVAIKHNAIIVDPGLAKVFAKLLTEHVQRFEKEHGAIPEPKIDPQSAIKTFVSKSDDRPGYFG